MKLSAQACLPVRIGTHHAKILFPSTLSPIHQPFKWMKLYYRLTYGDTFAVNLFPEILQARLN